MTFKKLKDLRDFLINKRGNGNTTVIKEIASKQNIMVLVWDDNDRAGYMKSGIKPQNIVVFSSEHDYRKILGMENIPLLVDNHVLLKIVHDSCIELDNKEVDIKRRQNALEDVFARIAPFVREQIYKEKSTRATRGIHDIDRN